MILHKVVKLNKKDEIEKTLWNQEFENFDFARLYYEQQRQQIEYKYEQTEILGIFSINGHDWFYSLDKELIMPSGETLFLNECEPDQVELSYFLHHSKPYLKQNKSKKVV